MKTIIHLSCDFPDPLASAKTRSVINLLDSTDGYRHVVYSLNRANWKSTLAALKFGPDRTALSYGAPPKGILHLTRLRRVAEWILQDVRANGVQPDLIHAHKLTVEGLVALDLAPALGVPFVCDIWGDTDLKITRARPDLSQKWREILQKSQQIFACAPWATDKFSAKFGLDPSKSTVLPPIVNHDSFMPSAPAGRPRLVTLFNLNAHRRKNLSGMVRAVMALSRSIPEITLDVWGVGDPAAFCEVTQIIRGAGAQGRVELKGRLPDGGFQQTLNQYAAFVMPTLRETFGMVFVEALFAGLPVLYTRNWSIDGLFDPQQVGYACDSGEDEDIRRGFAHLIENEARLKAGVVELNASGGLDPYRRTGVVATYRRCVEDAMARSSRLAA